MGIVYEEDYEQDDDGEDYEEDDDEEDYEATSTNSSSSFLFFFEIKHAN